MLSSSSHFNLSCSVSTLYILARTKRSAPIYLSFWRKQNFRSDLKVKTWVMIAIWANKSNNLCGIDGATERSILKLVLISGLTPELNSPVPIYTPGSREERHCDSTVACLRTQHNVPGQGSNPERSIHSWVFDLFILSRHLAPNVAIEIL